jgi:CCR4-NOT transcription complex subunit 1
MNESDVDYCLEIRNACLQIHPRLMNLIPGSDAEPGFSVVSYSPEIESEVDSIYKQMYDEHISIDEVIALLQRTKTSNISHDHEIFSCMLHFLFDEYKFFQSFYPARELSMTGYLFGSIIQHQLVEYIPLGIAIRYVLDALNCPPETNLFKFGVEALSRFESRLSEWQPLCQALLKIPHLLTTHPEIASRIHRAIATGDSNSSTADLRALALVPSTEPTPVFTAIQPDQLEGEIEKPQEEISDKILFIVNNLAPTNFESKLVEMKEYFQDQHARWFANYLVDQRIGTEPNNHGLYLRLLDALDRKVLSKFILHETIVKSYALLNSERTLQVTSERAVLKNIASWLGSISLARDRPIKHKNITFKDILIEGYESGRLLVAIPFVCKTLEPCSQSQVFKPPNPWLMAVLSLLAELYHFTELKLNPRFEIEMLFKGLDVDLSTIEATTVLRSRMPLTDSLAGPLPPDYPSDINDALPLGGFEPSSQLQDDSRVLPLGPATSSDIHLSLGPHLETILSSTLLHVTINPQLGPFSTNHAFKQAVHLAIERSVREVRHRI